MDLPVSPRFPGVTFPSTDFYSVQQKLRAGPFKVQVDLSIARTAANPLILPIIGNSFYIDQRQSSGYAVVRFNTDGPDLAAADVTCFPGFIARVPFRGVALENPAQAGQSLTIIYGVDIEFVPTPAAGVSVITPINSIEQINQSCQILGYARSAAVGVTSQTLLAPASNVRGFVAREVQLAVAAGAGGGINTIVVAASAAPVNVFVNQANAVLLAALANNTTNALQFEQTLARQVPAGWGVYELSSVTTAAGGVNGYVSGELL